MIAPCPAISRGTECSVPIVPGLVSEMVVSWKSVACRVPFRARRTTSSYAAQNFEKSRSSTCLILGTRSWREPSALDTSIAIPRLMWGGVTTKGFSSSSAK